MKKKHLQAVLFGPPGSGKGTQGELLADRFGCPFVGAGDLCRAEIANDTSLGQLVKEYVASGMLAPDELVNAIVMKQLKPLNLERGFLLDGYPRNVEQAEFLDRSVKINLAIQIKLDDAVAVRRLMGRRQCRECRAVFHVDAAPSALDRRCSLCRGRLDRRTDDTEDVIRHRLAIYHFMTEPMASYYRQRGVLLALSGGQSIEDLFEELVRKIGKLGFSA